jgi:hypothetical protein
VFGQPSVYNTKDPEAATLGEKKTGAKPKIVTVEECRLETILDRYLGGKSFELLAIDAEGYDIEILKSTNFARYAPRIILIEVNLPSFDDIGSNEVFLFLKSAGWQHHEGGFEAIGVKVERGDYVVKNHRFYKSDAVNLEIEITKLSDDATAFMLRVCKIFDTP